MNDRTKKKKTAVVKHKLKKIDRKRKDKSFVIFERLNWDDEYYNDLISGVGFTITEPPEISMDETKEKSLYGPQSPLYGSSFSDEQAFIERYRCKCGKLMSKQFEGEVCPICGSTVEYRDADIKTTGWISIGEENKIINPYFYHLLHKALGKIFPDIITAKFKIDTDGKKIKAKPEDLDETPTSPYFGIGIDEFYNKYEQILNYFKGLNKFKNKIDQIDVLLLAKRDVFTSHIPIYSTLLRPQSITSDSFYFGTVDKIINTLFNLSEKLKNCSDVEREYILSRIQTKCLSFWDTNFQMIHGKNGFPRQQMLGGRINYSARNVIIPAPDLKDNEIDLSYHTFLEVFKFLIINYISRLDDVSEDKAQQIWRRAYNFDEKVYAIMTYLVEQREVALIINRNPTLNYYSILLMRIRKVKHDSDDYCLSVPLSILPGLNADFDGDILNIIGLMDRTLQKMYRKYDPVTRMLTDRDSGLLNDYFVINKDQLINLVMFSTMGASPNDREETKSVEDAI